MNDNEFEKSIGDLPIGWQNFLIKTRGVASGPGQPPGPPPRPGLEWGPQTHRWLRPEQARQEQSKLTGVTQVPERDTEVADSVFKKPTNLEEAKSLVAKYDSFINQFKNWAPEKDRQKFWYALMSGPQQVSEYMRGIDQSNVAKYLPKGGTVEEATQALIENYGEQGSQKYKAKNKEEMKESKRQRSLDKEKLERRKGPKSGLKPDDYDEDDVPDWSSADYSHLSSSEKIARKAAMFDAFVRTQGSDEDTSRWSDKRKAAGWDDISEQGNEGNEFGEDYETAKKWDIEHGHGWPPKDIKKSFDYDTIRKAVELVKRRL